MISLNMAVHFCELPLIRVKLLHAQGLQDLLGVLLMVRMFRISLSAVLLVNRLVQDRSAKYAVRL